MLGDEEDTPNVVTDVGDAGVAESTGYGPDFAVRFSI